MLGQWVWFWAQICEGYPVQACSARYLGKGLIFGYTGIGLKPGAMGASLARGGPSVWVCRGWPAAQFCRGVPGLSLYVALGLLWQVCTLLEQGYNSKPVFSGVWMFQEAAQRMELHKPARKLAGLESVFINTGLVLKGSGLHLPGQDGCEIGGLRSDQALSLSETWISLPSGVEGTSSMEGCF